MLIKFLRLYAFLRLFVTVQIISLYYRIFLWLTINASTGNALRVTGYIKLRVDPRGRLEIRNNVRINSGNIQNSFGGHRKTVLRVLGGGKLTIGSNVGISNSTIICAEEIEIKDDVLIGGNCHIFDTDFHSVSYNNRMKRPDPNVKKQLQLLDPTAKKQVQVLVLQQVPPSQQLSKSEIGTK